MDRMATLNPGPQGRRHFLKCHVLVGKQRVSAGFRNCDPVKTCASGRITLKAPVGVPCLCKYRGGLICVTLNGDDMLSPGYGLYERVLTEITKITSEALKVIIGYRLAGEGENTVLNPGCCECWRRGTSPRSLLKSTPDTASATGLATGCYRYFIYLLLRSYYHFR